MKRYLTRALVGALLVWAMALTFAPSQSGEANSGPTRLPGLSASESHYRPGQILVKFTESTPQMEAARTLVTQSLSPIGEIGNLGILEVAVPQGQEETLVQMLSKDPRVEYAELDHVVRATIIPNDTEYHQQWAPGKIRAPAAWDVTVGDSNVIVAIVDTGVDLSHPDLNSKVVPGWDFANKDSVAQDDHGHGTHVAGIAAAETDNNRGIAGISWGALVMPVKVLDEHGVGYYSDVAKGMIWACNHGAKVINLSVGGSTRSSVLQQAVEEVYGNGCLVVAAAGNGGGDGVDYPARYAETMAVAATDQNDVHAGFSDYGPQVDIAAPGVHIYSTLWTPGSHTYGWKDGTSMSAPHVAGLAALIWSTCPDLSNGEVRDVIESTAKDLGAPGWDSYYGFGRVDAVDAVEAATPAPTLTVSTHQMLFLADATMGPWPQVLSIGNAEPCGSLSWHVADDADWLRNDPDAGEASASEPGQTSVTVDKSGLPEGNEYHSTITVSSTTLGVLESPQEVDVTFVYSAIPLHKTLLPLVMCN